MLRLYDSRRRRAFPLRGTGAVTMYVCGVTPYDTTHLGHARTYLLFDVLVRLLEAQGRRVRYAQNVTDIDESILQRAARDGERWDELGRREERKFLEDMGRLGWRRPDVVPHATKELRRIVGMTQRLLRTGAAYRLDGGVYFDVRRAPAYGELSRLPATRMRTIIAGQDDAALDDPKRKDPRDFALWRRVPDGPTWPSPFGAGRPGWHIECSAMALHHLGDRIDIHGGGADLIYPHHENEIAQSEAATGKRPFTRWWVHGGLVRIDGRKMSKSDGNMVFVREALARVSPEALRFYLLGSVSYRRPLDHDAAKLERAAGRQRALAARLGAPARTDRIGRDNATRAVIRELEDDVQIPRAIRLLERHARTTNDSVRASLRAVARRILGIV